METKKIKIIVSLISLFIILSIIPVHNTRQTIIKASLYDVAKQINNLNNWKAWNTDLSNSIRVKESLNGDQSAHITSAYSYLLHHVNPLEVLLVRVLNNSLTSSLIKIVSLTDTTTAISWSEKVTFFELIKRSTVEHYSRQVNLDNLKKFMEDANYKYGFIIKIVPVKDTLILTAEMSLNNSVNPVSYLYEELQAFIKENMLPAEKNYFYETQFNNNKIAVGIPVYKRIKTQENIKLLELPANGRLVEGTYSGKLTGKPSIYAAINNFMLDKHLKQVAQPLEQYNVADTILNANRNINIKIYYPVF